MITIRPYYGLPTLRTHLWCICVDGVPAVVTTTYPDYLLKD